MADDWGRLCDGSDGLQAAPPHVDVTFLSGRRHRVSVEETAGAYLLNAVVLRRAGAVALADLPIRVWEPNRSTALVGFRLDSHGRLIGEAWIPKAGMTVDEFQLHVRSLAAECDRFE